MMHPEPIVMTREEHMRHIASYWRQKDISRLRDECIFEDEERVIKREMYEPEPDAVDKAVMVIWSGYGLFLLLGALWIWEMIR